MDERIRTKGDRETRETGKARGGTKECGQWARSKEGGGGQDQRRRGGRQDQRKTVTKGWEGKGD